MFTRDTYRRTYIIDDSVILPLKWRIFKNDPFHGADENIMSIVHKYEFDDLNSMNDSQQLFKMNIKLLFLTFPTLSHGIFNKGIK